MLQVNKLSFAYDASNVLEGLSFEVRKGQHVAVMGKVAAEKAPY